MTYGKFTVTDHNHLNTGGNITVSIFAVYDSEANVTRWVIANEDGFNWQTADTISSELQLDSDELTDKIVLGSWPWDALVTDPSFDQHLFEDDEWYLFKYCQFEFYKRDCKYFNTRYRLGINELPNDLYIRLSAEYIEWANREGVGCLTDGYDVFMDESYAPPVTKHDKDLADLKEFFEWYNDLPSNDELRDNTQYITIAVAGNSTKIRFHADSYNSLHDFLETIIKDY